MKLSGVIKHLLSRVSNSAPPLLIAPTPTIIIIWVQVPPRTFEIVILGFVEIVLVTFNE